jgi:2-polyprenyl-3-methyl-5-hydroxy-6-metoxy-1,4-benzoquinol methylase
MPPREAYENVAGNYYDKYNSRNPIARYLVAAFLRQFVALAALTGVRDAFEVGCGEGVLSMELLRRGWDVRGVDLEASVVGVANDTAVAQGFGRRFETSDVMDLRPDSASASLIVCCEVLEHVPDPDAVLGVLVTLAKPWLLLSVPREPVWRILNFARGKYVRHLGNTPGHIQHWSRRAFMETVSRKADVIEVRTPLPWTMLLCRCPRS